jgi:hypothetical protein
MLTEGKIRNRQEMERGDNIEIMTIIQDYKVSPNIPSLSEGQVIQAKNVVKMGQVVTERIVSLTFNDKLDSDHYDATLPAYEKKRLGTNGNLS